MGCASTPEEKVAQERRKVAAEQRKTEEASKHWLQVLAPYSDEQLRFKLAGLEQAIASSLSDLAIFDPKSGVLDHQNTLVKNQNRLYAIWEPRVF